MHRNSLLWVAALGALALIAVIFAFFSNPQTTEPIVAAPAPLETASPVSSPLSKEELAVSSAPKETLTQAPPAAPAPPPFLQGGPPKVPPEILARMQDPQAQARVAESMAKGLRTMYADILATLSPQDADRLVQALVQEQMSRASKLLTQAPPTALQDIQREMRESDQRLEAAMGSQLFQKYKQNSKSLTERRLVRDFSDSVSSSGMSLTPDQTSALVSLLAAQRATARDSALKQMAVPSAGTGTVSSPQQIIQRQQGVDAAVRATDSQVVEQARKFLSAEQVGALQFFLSSQSGMSAPPSMPPGMPPAPR